MFINLWVLILGLTAELRRSWYRGESRNFLGGGALVSCSTSTPINHIVFLQNTSCIRKPQVISGGGAHPLHPPPRSAPVVLRLRCFGKHVIDRVAFPLRRCLHGGGVPQVGEVTCGGSPHLSCERLYGQAGYYTLAGYLTYLGTPTCM